MSTDEPLDKDTELGKLARMGATVRDYRKLARKGGPLHQQMRRARAADATQAEIMAASGYGSIYRVRIILGEAIDPKATKEGP
jgi:hypothetical protein